MTATGPGDIGFLGNLFARGMWFPKKGDVVRYHKHKFDHLTVVLVGSILLKADLPDGRHVERVVPSFADALDSGLIDFETMKPIDVFRNPGIGWAVILKGVEHELIAQEDRTIAACLYAHRTAQGEVIAEFGHWDAYS